MASDRSNGSRAAHSGEEPAAPSTIAATLIEAGYTVIPVRGKTPWDVVTDGPMREWQNASFTTADLLSAFEAPTITGVGVNLGRSRLADVDCDTPEAVHAAALLLPSTATFGRASNPTSHYIFAVDQPIATLKFQVPAIPELGFADGEPRRQATLLELRCQGAQTVFPGSLWRDDEDASHVEWIAWDAVATPARIDGQALRRRVGLVAAATLLARCWPPPGSHVRHDFALALAGWLIRAGLSEDYTRRLIDVAARVAGDDEAGNRVAGVVSSANRARHGDPMVGGRRLAELLPSVAFDRLRAWLELGERARATPSASREPGEDDCDDDAPGAAEQPQRFRVLSGDEILNMPPPVWTVHGLIESGSLAVLYGAPGTGKSFIGLDIALWVAEGLPWQGRAVRGGPVVYIAAEGGGGLGIRCRAWCAWHKRPLPRDFGLIKEAPDLFGSDADVEALIAAIRTHLGDRTPVLIFVDTLARSMVGGEENSNSDMGVVIDRCTRLQREFDTAVCLVHHTTKADAERERGATSLRGAADTMFLVGGDKPSIYLATNKQKNAREADPVWMELVSVELEDVEEGSCVVLPGKSGQRSRVSGRHAETALDILVNQFGGKVSWAMWMKSFCADTSMKESTFFRAHRALAAAKRIRKDGRFWVPVEDS